MRLAESNSYRISVVLIISILLSGCITAKSKQYITSLQYRDKGGYATIYFKVNTQSSLSFIVFDNGENTIPNSILHIYASSINASKIFTRCYIDPSVGKETIIIQPQIDQGFPIPTYEKYDLLLKDEKFKQLDNGSIIRRSTLLFILGADQGLVLEHPGGKFQIFIITVLGPFSYQFKSQRSFTSDWVILEAGKKYRAVISYNDEEGFDVKFEEVQK